MSRDSALKVIVQQFGPGIANRATGVEYGSFVDNNYRRMTPLGLQSIGKRDVWKITATGLDLERPCGVTVAPGGCGQLHTLVLFVDDKTGSYIEGVGY